MGNIIMTMIIDGVTAELVQDDNGKLNVIYKGECIEEDVGCSLYNIKEERWIGESLIKFAVNNYKRKNDKSFSDMVKLLD